MLRRRFRLLCAAIRTPNAIQSVETRKREKQPYEDHPAHDPHYATVAIMGTSGDRTGIVIPPPLWFLVPFAFGWLNDRRSPWPLAWGRGVSLGLGSILIAGGVAIALAGVVQFRRGHTTVLPFGGTSELVTSGIYRVTRNPMYLGMALTYIGLALRVNSAWCLLFLPVALALAHVFAIRPEERYLLRKFGAPYRDYCERVRRWI